MSDNRQTQTRLVRLLEQKGWRIATAESLTGGLVSRCITDVSGASRVFECGVCSYSDRIKQQVLGVSPLTLAQWGAISAQTAREMAAGVQRLSGAQLAVSTTGNAGPDASENKPVGLVYLGLAGPGGCQSRELHLTGDRESIRAQTAQLALEFALEVLESDEN